MTDMAITDEILQVIRQQISPFKFCKVTDTVWGVSITVDYSGTPVDISAESNFCGAWPLPNDWVAVGINGTDRAIVGIRPDVGSYIPNVEDGLGPYLQIGYGTPNARELQYERKGDWVTIQGMIRLPDPNWGFGGYITMSLPFPWESSLGNGVAPHLGTISLGVDQYGEHHPAIIHGGRPADLSNHDVCWFVNEDQPFGILVSTYGNPPSADLHTNLSYRAASIT